MSNDQQGEPSDYSWDLRDSENEERNIEGRRAEGPEETAGWSYPSHLTLCPEVSDDTHSEYVLETGDHNAQFMPTAQEWIFHGYDRPSQGFGPFVGELNVPSGDQLGPGQQCVIFNFYLESVQLAN
tara:strand:- start:4089 stop:4466 length:378 start_codon:yes stop_codon:yes gene_type:complete